MEPVSAKIGCCAGSRPNGPVTADQTYLQRAQDVGRASAAVMAALRDRLRPIPGGFFDRGTRKSTFAADHPVSPPGLPWWRRVNGASWARPEGAGSTLQGRESHPAVHIAWYDALAYCNWAGLTLPTEAQWERAARGGLTHCKFPWGNEKTPNGSHQMNTFQGVFPSTNSAEDGWSGTAPVGAFTPNAYGMFNMTGNVWEWVNDAFGPLPASDSAPATKAELAQQSVEMA